MRTSILATTLLLIAMLCFVPLSYVQANDEKTTIEDVQKETQDLISKIKGYSADQRDEAIKQTDQALQKLDRRIDALETDIQNRWDQMDKATREKSQAGLKELRRQRVNLAEWYGSFKHSSLSVWEQVKNGFADAYQSIVDTWVNFRKQY